MKKIIVFTLLMQCIMHVSYGSSGQASSMGDEGESEHLKPNVRSIQPIKPKTLVKSASETNLPTMHQHLSGKEGCFHLTTLISDPANDATRCFLVVRSGDDPKKSSLKGDRRQLTSVADHRISKVDSWASRFLTQKGPSDLIPSDKACIMHKPVLLRSQTPPADRTQYNSFQVLLKYLDAGAQRRVLTVGLDRDESRQREIKELHESFHRLSLLSPCIQRNEGHSPTSSVDSATEIEVKEAHDVSPSGSTAEEGTDMLDIDYTKDIDSLETYLVEHSTDGIVKLPKGVAEDPDIVNKINSSYALDGLTMGLIHAGQYERAAEATIKYFKLAGASWAWSLFENFIFTSLSDGLKASDKTDDLEIKHRGVPVRRLLDLLSKDPDRCKKALIHAWETKTVNP